MTREGTKIAVVGTGRLYNDLHAFDYYMSEGR